LKHYKNKLITTILKSALTIKKKHQSKLKKKNIKEEEEGHVIKI
jgi:hypothetical protein